MDDEPGVLTRVARKGRAAVSCREDFLPARSGADHLRPVGIIEMTADRVARRIAQGPEIVGLGEDRVAKGARDEAAFRRFLDAKMISLGRLLMPAS